MHPKSETIRLLQIGGVSVATIKDVARLANVSMATVSKYINGGNVRADNESQIRSAIEELDYRVNPFARNLKSQRSHSIGILLPNMTAPFFGSVITEFEKAVREQGYHTIISCYGSNHGLERDNLMFLISNGIDGLIYIPEDITAEEFHELTFHRSVPTVLIDRIVPGIESDAVLVDNADAVYKAVCELYKKGHQRIALIAGPKSVYTAKERQVGYLRAISDNNIIFDDQLIISDKNEFATGYRGCEALMSLENPPTAIVTTNYDITIGLVTAARDRGLRIPDDVDIFGFDCVEVCSMMRPPLPVVHQPEQEIGRTAAKYLLERLQGYSGPYRITRLNCKLT